MEYDVPINDKIDPTPAPQTCLDGLMRHFQAYEQTVQQLQHENQELREQLGIAHRQIDLMRTQQLPIAQVSNQPISSPQPRQREPNGDPQVENIPISSSVNNVGQPPGQLRQIVTNPNTAKNLSKTLRRIYMHSRGIIKLHMFNNLLLTGSRDGTARIWSANDQTFKTSLYAFRAPCQLLAVQPLEKSGVMALAAKNKRVYLYQMEVVMKQLAEYAEVQDLNDGLFKHIQSGENFIQLQDQVTCISELQARSVLIFGCGFMSNVSLENGSFNVVSTQPFSEATNANEPLYFAHSVSHNGGAYVVVRERFIQKSNNAYLSVFEQPSAAQLSQYTRTSVRLLHVSQQMKIQPFTLQAPGQVLDLTPISMFTVNEKIILVFSQFEQKFAAFDPSNNQFQFVKETQLTNGEGQNIMCGCGNQNKIYIVAGNTQFEPVKVHVFQLEGFEAKLVESLTIDEYVGYATQVVVQDGQIVIGGLDGEVAVRVL
ncbi:Conserved_hypothetical protein [Hexamita inflata]|uniref:Uncharacterized protein n=1 Tax=Hexamita inflata TaxID=28002 RepID=A0AA86UIP0_9EUKA|nr:Conserved hypothetical protein [Hexamita inflata]